MPRLNWRDFVRESKKILPAFSGRVGLIHYGPKELGLRLNPVPTEGPEAFYLANRALFATGSTSRDEGYAFWALLHLIGPERQIGKNGMVWYYQSKQGQKSVAFETVDFVVEIGHRRIAIRIVTAFFHLQAGATKREFDFEQIFQLFDQGFYDVVDVYSQNYINDPSGRAAMKVMSNAIEDVPDTLPVARHWR